MTMNIGLARVAGYCRVRHYDNCATDEEVDVGMALRFVPSRPATQNECFEYMMRHLAPPKKLENNREDKV